MKKTLFLLCAIFVILLAGCAKQEQITEPASETDAETTIDATVEKTEAQPVRPAPSGPVELKVPAEDRNQAFNCQFVETEEGYYYVWDRLTENGMLNLVYFCARGDSTFYPLCNKPNCKHSDSNCNAFCGTELGYYNNALYTMDFSGFQGLQLIKMNLDGSDHQVVAELDPSEGTGSMSFLCAFHHGKFFLLSEPTDDMPLDQQQYRLIVVNLADGSKSEPAAEYFNTEKDVPNRFWYYKDKLYGIASGKDKALSLIEIDTATGTTKAMDVERTSSFYATDSTLYYLVANAGNANQTSERSDPGFREYDLESGTVKDCGLPAEGIINADYDEDYIYAGGNYSNDGQEFTLYLLSRDYKLVDQIELTGGLGVAAVTSDRIYFSGMDHCITCYLDKSQIGSGNLQLIPIETIG